MNTSPWKIIANINCYINPFRENNTRSNITDSDVIKLRSNIRNQLELLRNIITEQYSEHDAYYVIFPLTVHCDELVKKIVIDNKELDWFSLQDELYKVDGGGDLFYEMLDSLLTKKETLPLVYQVYLFCLNDGFCGRYTTNPERIGDYIKELHNHINLSPVTDTVLSPTVQVGAWNYYRKFSGFYYLSVCLILVLYYLLLTNLASNW
jgi:type VI protein secretion system component VasF